LRATDVRGKRFSILGGARSGLAAAGLLRSHGAAVFLSDRAPEEKMAQARAELELMGVPAEFGANTRRVLEADVVVLSPGVPSDAPIVREALALGKAVVSEVEVASWFCPGPIAAITGTNGKTTTTALLGRMFEDAKRPAVVAGNIGTAFSQVVGGMAGGTAAILEISSFQLDHIDTFRPAVGVLLNITPDHLDRYEHAFEKYIASKCRIFENQGAGDVLVYNHDDPVARENVLRHLAAGVTALPFSTQERLPQGAFLDGGLVRTIIGERETDVLGPVELSIKGAHNLANAMAATLTAQAMGIPIASLRATLRNFKAVEHRLEFVRELDGVTYVNDSKATNVDSVWYALQSFASPIVVLMGGRDKGNDYTRLLDLVRKNVRAVVAIGESAGTVERAFGAVVPVRICTTMEDAVQQSRRLASPGDVVLLSPACASFDWFVNYEHRGRVFKQLVMQLI
jgi:UDP-N-acetylmuramoylalanine--D-glutamate ligase